MKIGTSSLFTGAVLVLLGLGVGSSNAAVVASLNNLEDGITIDGSRADWAGVTAYPSDPTGDGSDLDYTGIRMANNSSKTTLFIRTLLDSRTTGFGSLDNIFIDTDLDRGTGYIASLAEFSLGADYLIQGASIFEYTGSPQTAWGWNFLGSASFNDGGTGLDIEMSISLALLGSPETFNFIVLGDNVGTKDYYPNNSNGGATGDVFQYTTITPVPEPAALGLIGLGSLLLVAVRRKTIK